jgi:hypothetical protein
MKLRYAALFAAVTIAGCGTKWELVRGGVTFDAQGWATLSCPGNKFAVNGGNINDLGAGRERLMHAPGLHPSGKSWEFQGTAGGSLQAWVVCVAP